MVLLLNIYDSCGEIHIKTITRLFYIFSKVLYKFEQQIMKKISLHDGCIEVLAKEKNFRIIILDVFLNIVFEFKF